MLILIRTYQKLKQQQRPVRLNITTIRPGSFKALQDHLETERNKVYHLAHLDLHGDTTPADDGRRWPTLLRGWGRERSTGCRRSSPSSVARRRHPLCCHERLPLSPGRHHMTGSPEHAASNTAAAFLLNGAAQHVLAMSFEIL